MIVNLNPQEAWVAKQVGLARYKCARKNGVVDAQIGKQDKEFIDINGYGGELAVCRALNVWPDISVSQRKGGWDCSYNGITIDVKTTHHANGRLLVSLSKKLEYADRYILVIGNLPDYRIAGWMDAAKVIGGQQRDLGHGPGWSIDQKDLYPFSTFKFFAVPVPTDVSSVSSIESPRRSIPN